MQPVYVCPKTKEFLRAHDKGLLSDGGVIYPFIIGNNNIRIPNFLAAYEHGAAAKQSLAMYDQKVSPEIYRNFLDWLFQTFNEREPSFRESLMAKLKLRAGGRVLITGCGLGDDILSAIDAVGSDGEVYANDLAAEMVLAASHHVVSDQPKSKKIFFSVCDAKLLPFPDSFFDGAFHLGGINLFDDIKSSVSEMERVVKPGGRVVFGDEGIAPWLKDTEYGRIAVMSNALWKAEAPIHVLPRNAVDVSLSWVLGNCFYVISFEVSEKGPYMNIDVPYKGSRGGTMRTRCFGQLEGVSEKTKTFVLADAQRKGLSVHEWLEQVISEKRKDG